MSRVNYSSQDKEDSRLFMMIFRYLYAGSDKTLNHISQGTNLSVNALTLMKNGQKTISFSSFDKLYTYFTGNRFQFNYQILDELHVLFRDMVQKHIDIDVEGMESIIETILGNREKFEHSFGFFIYHLVDLFWAFWQYDNDSITRVADLTRIQSEHEICQFGTELYSPLQLSFFYDVIGLQAIEEGNIDQGYALLEEAEKYTGEVEVVGFKQVIEYHKARIADKRGQSIQGFMDCEALSTYFARHHNLTRYCYIENCKVYLLTDMGKFNEAHKLAQALIQASHTMKDADIEIYITHSMIWNAIMAGWFKNALYHLHRPELKGKLSPMITGFEPLCLAMLDQSEAARKSLQSWKSRLKPKKIEYLHAVLDDILEGRQRMFLRSVQVFSAYCKKNGFRQSEKLSYIIKIHICKKFKMMPEYHESIHDLFLWMYPSSAEPELPE